MATGQRRLTFVAPAKADGTVSSTELVHATSLVLRAIEQAPAPAAAPAAVAAKPALAPRGRMLARR
jgi:hypothetical protein